MAAPARYRPTSKPTPARVSHARWGVMGLFFSMGVMLATFLSRIPTIRDQLGVDKGRLSTLIIFGAGGALVALLLTGWAAARFGTRALLMWTTVAYTVSFIAIGVSSELGIAAGFAAFQFLSSFSFSFTNVSMNAEAAVVERHVGRKIMPQFHAAFSVGMAVGLAVGWLFSEQGVAPLWHFAGVGLILMVVRLLLIPVATTTVDRPAARGATFGGPFAMAHAEYRDRRVLMIGVIIFAASMTEGAAAQWIALAAVDDFDQPEARATSCTGRSSSRW